MLFRSPGPGWFHEKTKEWVYMCIYIHMCRHVYIHKYLYTHINIYTHVNTSMNTCGCVRFVCIVLCINKIHTYTQGCVYVAECMVYMYNLYLLVKFWKHMETEIFLSFQRERIYFLVGKENQTSTSLQPLKLESSGVLREH